MDDAPTPPRFKVKEKKLSVFHSVLRVRKRQEKEQGGEGEDDGR